MLKSYRSDLTQFTRTCELGHDMQSICYIETARARVNLLRCNPLKIFRNVSSRTVRPGAAGVPEGYNRIAELRLVWFGRAWTLFEPAACPLGLVP